jgi:transcriptional regulator with XRE-family HTH domain
MKLSDKIRTLRKMKGLSQENMADMIGISSTAYAKIERNESDPAVSRIESIAQALNMSKAYLENFGENGVFYLNESNNNNSNSVFVGNSANPIELAMENTRLNTENDGLRNEVTHLKKIIALLEEIA